MSAGVNRHQCWERKNVRAIGVQYGAANTGHGAANTGLEAGNSLTEHVLYSIN